MGVYVKGHLINSETDVVRKICLRMLARSSLPLIDIYAHKISGTCGDGFTKYNEDIEASFSTI
jgi:hypothetical protein